MTPAEPIIDAIRQLDNIELAKVRDEVLLEIERRGPVAVPAATVSDDDDLDDDDWENGYCDTCGEPLESDEFVTCEWCRDDEDDSW